MMRVNWKYSLMFIGITMGLALNPVFVESSDAGTINSIEKHDKLVYLFGGFDTFGPWGGVIDKEKELSSISTTVTYIDNSEKKCYLDYTLGKFGIVGEYVISDSVGIQVGYVFNNLTQKIHVGGGNYVGYDLGERNLLNFTDVFLGANWYFYNDPESNMFLLGRIGSVTNGKIFPHVNNFEYIGCSIDSYDLTGYNFTIGIGGSYAFNRKWFLGATADFDHNMLSVAEEIPGYNTNSFSLDVMTWYITLGVRL